MTVQEILLLDGDCTIRVGVNKLQQILNTMRVFKDDKEHWKAKHYFITKEYNTLVDTYAETKEELEMQQKVVFEQQDSINRLLAQVEELKTEVKTLQETKIRMGAIGPIDISLDDL